MRKTSVRFYSSIPKINKLRLAVINISSEKTGMKILNELNSQAVPFSGNGFFIFLQVQILITFPIYFQTPGICPPQKPHFPSLILFSTIENPCLFITVFPHIGQTVFP